MNKRLKLFAIVAITLLCSCEKEEGPPIITYTPPIVEIGTHMFILGKNLGTYRDKVEVLFNGVPVSYANVEDNGTRISFIVPDNITPGKISVSVNSLTTASSDTYIVSNWKLLSQQFYQSGEEVPEEIFCKYNERLFLRVGKSIRVLNRETKELSMVTNFPSDYPEYNINDPHSYTPISFFSIENRIYIQFEHKLPGEDHFRFYEYNLVTNQWTQKSRVPVEADSYSLGFSLVDKGYFIFRYTPWAVYEKLWGYDPNTDTWTELATFPGPLRKYYTLYKTSTHAYLGAGDADDGPALKDRWQYEPVSNTWTKVEDFPGNPRENPITFNINNHIYYGLNMSGSFEFDPATFNWTSFENIISDQYLIYAGRPNQYLSDGDKGYLLKGGQVWEFNP